MVTMAASQYEIIDIQDKEGEETNCGEDVEVMICHRSGEALMLKKGVDALVPCSRGLLQVVQSLPKVHTLVGEWGSIKLGG